METLDVVDRGPHEPILMNIDTCVNINEYRLSRIGAAHEATKLVVSVIDRPGQPDPSAMRTGTTQVADVRHDPTIAVEVARFLQQHGVEESVTSDRIIGCPHEEGIDYPMGRTCPECPFWANIDRFTHEPLRPPAPTMSAAEILQHLSVERSVQPREALESADAHRDVLGAPLLRALERGIGDPSGASPEEATLFAYALYLLAKWREPRAYPYVLRWLTLPGEGAFDRAGLLKRPCPCDAVFTAAPS